jgi:hypothetical protein
MQASGHHELFFEGDRLAKAGVRVEMDFYDRVFREDETNRDIISLRTLMPAYHGRQMRGETELMVMENMCFNMTFPCILDVKLGTVTWFADAAAKKVKSKSGKADRTTSSQLGFRIAGRVYKDQEGNQANRWDKNDKFAITATNVQQNFTDFVSGRGHVRVDVAQKFLEATKRALDWFMVQKSLCFCAPSLLYIYDQGTDEVRTSAKMIDFAYVRDSTDYDHSKH